jgi:hypothetical protein
MTNEQRAKLANLAVAMALEVPEKQQAATAQVPWSLIHKVRAICEEIGFDWRQARKDVAATNRANYARWLEERRTAKAQESQLP